MDFTHTEDRRMLGDSLNRFVKEQYGFDTRDRIARSSAGYSPQLWRRFAELGVIGALFTEANGGFGGAGFDVAVVFEALGCGLVVEPFLGTAVLAGGAIAALADDAQRGLLAEIIGGTLLAAFAHGEPDARYELARVTTRAQRQGDGWVIGGAKAVVLHAEDDEAGLSLFLVPAKAAGVSLRGYPLIDGGRAAELTLRDVTLGAGALLGAEGQAFTTIEQVTGTGILALCAEALGAMDAAKDATLEYLRTRRQFGVPIGSFQALQHRMADLLLEMEQARSAVINAAAALDADRITRERALSAAKFTIGRVGIRVAEESIQMHGGIGMTWELPLSTISSPCGSP